MFFFFKLGDPNHIYYIRDLDLESGVEIPSLDTRSSTAGSQYPKTRVAKLSEINNFVDAMDGLIRIMPPDVFDFMTTNSPSLNGLNRDQMVAKLLDESNHFRNKVIFMSNIMLNHVLK